MRRILGAASAGAGTRAGATWAWAWRPFAEDLVLLIDAESGKFTNATPLDIGTGRALLVKLAQTVEVVEGSGLWAGPRSRHRTLRAR